MYEVTIPLRPVKDNEVGAPEDFFKIIREEYASRYLEMLNIASTPANKADFMRYRMMDDCDMMGIWPDLRTSALADAIRIVPPLRQRIGDLADMEESLQSDPNMWRHWYGRADPILVKPPDIGATCNTVRMDAEEEERHANGIDPSSAGGAPVEPGSPEAASQQSNVLVAELEQLRLGGDKFAEVGKGLRAANSRNDAERRERMKEEVASLKAKFILPFACERPAKEGGIDGPSKKAELVVWPMEGPLIIDAPHEMWAEVLQPIHVTFDDLKKNIAKWVDEQIPLEYLTSRRDEKLWDDVHATLKDADVAKLTGLLAHLLHWVTLMPLRTTGPQLSDSALQSLFVAIHELWSKFEKSFRDSKAGVSFVLPCLMLTIKRGMERCFEMSYSSLMSSEVFRQQVIDRINTLLMRLFDPDGCYARFGKFDGEGKALQLSKKLDQLMSFQGSNSVKRLHGRMHRSTPLVRAVLGLAGNREPGTVVDQKTRQMMLHGEHAVVCSGASGIVDFPWNRDRQGALLKAAMNRLPQRQGPAGMDFTTRQPSSARQPRGRQTKLKSPRSARGDQMSLSNPPSGSFGAESPREVSSSSDIGLSRTDKTRLPALPRPGARK